ncbi:MAG TPA: transglutaminaseTgpA domain-containing protein [Euzebyales bacterium]
MTTLLDRPAGDRRARARPRSTPPSRSVDLAGTLRVAALVFAATLPFGRVFITGEWFAPLVLAGLLPVGISLLARQLRLRWWWGVGLQVVAWLWFAAFTLLPSTLWAGLPTTESVRLAIRVGVIAVERVAVLPAPVYPEVPLLLLGVSGVWWVAASIDVLALRLEAPGKAVVCAATLWIVPLAIVPGGDAPWLLAAPLLLAGAAMLHAQAERDFVRWGPQVTPGGHRQPVTTQAGRQSSGAALAVCALLAGALLAGMLPGFGDPPWYELRARATTTLTDNPIVQLRANLVATDPGAVLQVRSPEPVYLRSTALDVYSEAEVWETSGIEPRPLRTGGYVPGGVFTANTNRVRIEVVDVTDGVLVPTPIGPTRFEPPGEITPRYDQRTSTFTFGDDRLQTGQRYAVDAGRARINPDVLMSMDAPAPPHLTALPDPVPPEVNELARRIVADAGAESPFQQALAIQNELRTWEYSLQPPAGHSGVAMRTFLEQRVGYCEQFAGTMAVMLRTLGIPARVAVGFTPGTVDPDDPTLWTVSWANAHAWVEVRFGGSWVAFEPTPRSDGNVLVPSVADPVPSQTLQAPQQTTTDGSGESPNFDIFDEREALQNQAAREAQGGTAGLIGGGAGPVTRLARPSLLLTVALTTLAALVLLVLLGRRAADATSSPSGRVLAVRERIGRLGRGLGTPAPSWETDHEYLQRLAPDDDNARELAAAVTVARYAPSVADDVAVRAEEAGGALTAHLLEGHAWWRRALIHARGDAAAGWERLRRWRRR